MKPEMSITRVDNLKRKQAASDLLDAVEGTPSQHKAAMIARIMKDVIAGKITAAEANEMRKAIKV